MSTYKIDPPAPPLLLGEAEAREFYEVRPNKPDPERGYPELWWKGKRPFNGIHFYPAQKHEEHGPAVNGWRNKLYWGDNLQGSPGGRARPVTLDATRDCRWPRERRAG